MTKENIRKMPSGNIVVVMNRTKSFKILNYCKQELRRRDAHIQYENGKYKEVW